MTREQKTFTFEVKSTDDAAGTIEGYLSVFGVVDQGKDRVIKGAFKRTIANSKKRAADSKNTYIFPMLWQHRDDSPIGGVIDAKEDDYGLFTVAQFDLDTQRGREAYSGYKKGYLNQLSIGYDVVRKSYDAKGVRDLEEIRLWEQSTVTFAMNEEALVTAVKSAGQGSKDFNDRYRAQQISSWRSDFYDLTCALQQSIQDAFASGDEPQADLVDIILNDSKEGTGFITALKAYVQEGIDLNYANYLQEQTSAGSYVGMMSSGGPEQRKAGGMSASKRETIAANIDTLQGLADVHKASAARHTKALHSIADDLATMLQGSEAAYGTDHGTSETGNEGTSKARPHHDAPGTGSSSPDDTDLDTALAQLLSLRTLNTTTSHKG